MSGEPKVTQEAMALELDLGAVGGRVLAHSLMAAAILSSCPHLNLKYHPFLTPLLLRFWPHFTPYGILGSLSRDGTRSPAVEVRSSNHWTTRDVPHPSSSLCWVLLRLVCMLVNNPAEQAAEQVGEATLAVRKDLEPGF